MFQPLDVIGFVGTVAVVACLVLVAAGASLWTLRGLDPLALLGGRTGGSDFLRRRSFDPLLYVTGVFAYFVLVPAVYLTFTRDFAYGHADPGVKLARALVVLLVAYVALLVGYAVVRRLLRASDLPPLERPSVDSRVLLVLGLAGTAIGVIAFAYFVVINGGFTRLMTVKPRTAFQTVPNTGKFRLLGLMGVFGGWLTVWIALYPVVDDTKRSLLSRTGLLLAGSLGLALAFAVFSRERLKILYIILFSVSYVATTSRVDIRRLTAYGCGLVLFGISFTAVEQAAIGSARFADLFHSVLNPLRLEALMEVVAGVPSERPYQGGATYLNTFVSDRGTGTMAYGDQVELLLRGRNAEAIGFSAMIWGEMWLNFGPPGILVGSGLYGAAIGAVAWFQRNAVSPALRGLSAVLVATVAIAIPAASTWISKVLFTQTLLPVLVALGVAYLVGRRTSLSSTDSPQR